MCLAYDGVSEKNLNPVCMQSTQKANTSGSQSQKWKVDKIKSLLVRAKGYEPKYIIRGLQGKLRIGLASTTVLASLAHAVVLTHPKGVEILGEDRLEKIRALDGTEGKWRFGCLLACDGIWGSEMITAYKFKCCRSLSGLCAQTVQLGKTSP